MSSSPTPPVTPWHRRVLDWLGVKPAEDGVSARAPDAGERFSWEPVPPAPRPPQWGAANQPALLLGLDEGDAATAHGTAPPPKPAPTPSPHRGMAS